MQIQPNIGSKWEGFNRGYFLEDLGQFYKLWEKLPMRPHQVSGDVILSCGLHAQVKYGRGGQVNASTMEELPQRLEDEKSDVFIVGLPKGSKTLLFYFTKEDFINLIMKNPSMVKVEKMSPCASGNKNKNHIRLAFGTSGKKLLPLKQASYKIQTIDYKYW